MRIRNIILFSILFFYFTGCSNKKIYVEDVNKLLSEKDTMNISQVNTTNYKFYIFVSNEYTFEDDYIFMSNEYLTQHNIKQDNLIMYYIGMKNHSINIQVTDYVQKKISQHRLDEAVSIMASSFRNNEYGKGIIDSVRYLDKKIPTKKVIMEE